jgi:two-component system response regulator DegU
MANTILLVDDHREFRQIVRQVLQTEPDLVVAGEAEDGEAAVAFVRTHGPALVLMDVAMPRLDGLEASRGIKALRPETKVLVLAVHTDSTYREKARASGVDAYLAKQDTITRLVPTIRRVLGTARAEG